MLTIERAKELKVIKSMCKDEYLFHSAYMFMQREKREFVLNSHHQAIARVIELVMQGVIKKLIINMPPRYGKTEMAVTQLVTHAFSLNTTAKFIHLSFSQSLVEGTSEGIQNIIRSDYYQELFPNVRINHKTSGKKRWATTDGGVFYAVATGGQVTGHGAGKVDDPKQMAKTEPIKRKAIETMQDIDKLFEDIISEMEGWDNITMKEGFNGALIIDDPIKPEDADSEVKRKRINERWDSTLKNRLNSRNTPVILIGQRTHELDLTGYVMENEGYTESIEEAIADPTKWLVLKMPAIVNEDQPDEHALWEFKHNLAELKALRAADSITFDRQYQQDPQPKEGLMYGIFRTYKNRESIPLTQRRIKKNYTDTADKGSDFLVSGNYIETDSAAYITDVECSTDPIKQTAPRVAMMLAKEKTDICRVESNNGGEQFMDSVEGQTRVIGNLDTQFISFHQSKNKEARIYSNSARVMNLIYMPEDWETRWPVFARMVKRHKKNGKNAHDDPADFLTGVVEYFGQDEPVNLDADELGGFA